MCSQVLAENETVHIMINTLNIPTYKHVVIPEIIMTLHQYTSIIVFDEYVLTVVLGALKEGNVIREMLQLLSLRRAVP